MSTAVDMYLNQIALTGHMPFMVKLPQAPSEINADEMSAQELRAKLQKGFDDIGSGRVQKASEAFKKRGAAGK